MSALVAVPVIVPLLGAALSIVAGRSRVAQRTIGLLVLGIVTVDAALLVARVDDHGPIVVHAGAWDAPVGISYVADRFAASLLLASAVVLLAVLVYAIGQREVEHRHVGFHPVYLVLASGVASSFLAGDLFNLFVAFEVMLTASYVLMTFGARAEQVRSGMTYVVISLVASLLFLFALALVYAATGTVNMADLHDKIAGLPLGVQRGLAVLLLVVFGIKAAVFPLFFWLPDSYPTAPSPVTAVFAGLLTKVGVYALVRSQTLLFDDAARPATLLLVVAGCTMVVGVFGAIVQNDIKRILSFHIVSQIGYMVLGLGLFTVAGLAAATVYIINQIVLKTSLLLVAGIIEERRGSGALSKLSGLVRLEPVVAVLFLLPALSLAGVPPFSGFVAKLAVVDAGVDARGYGMVALALAVSLLTLYSMTKIWANVFWGAPEAMIDDRAGPPASGAATPAAADHATDGAAGTVHAHRPTTGTAHHAVMAAATGALVLAGLVLAVLSGPLYDFAERAANDLLHPDAYLAEVLGR